MVEIVRLSYVCLFVLIFLSLFFAQGAHGEDAAIAQAFRAEGKASNFALGVLVAAKSDDAESVVLATSGGADRLIGVVSDDPLVALSDKSDTIKVVIGGTTRVLVSDINGSVRAGDRITISPIAGVGMLAAANTQVIGSARGGVDPKTAKKRVIKDRNGREQSVSIGYVPVQVSITYYQAPGNGLVPPFVQGLANSIAGRQVSLVRILAASLLLIFTFVSTAGVLYVSVRSGIISIGRNPLAAKAIRGGLAQVGLAVTLALSLALLACYIILVI